MSEAKPQISSGDVKPKDPKRVEQGKRLGAISKVAKEKKARERYDKEREETEGGGETSGWGVPIAGATVLGVAFLCYKNRHRIGGREELAPQLQPETDEDDAKENTIPVTKSGRKLGSFD